MSVELLDAMAATFPDEVRIVYDEIRARWKDVVFTGSQAIGCAGPESDWDFVVSEEWPFDPESLGVEATDGPRSLTRRMVEADAPKFTNLRFGPVNLIVDHREPEILDSWRIATDYCTEHCVFDKPERIRVFENFGAG